MGLRALRLLVEGSDDIKLMMDYQIDIFSMRYEQKQKKESECILIVCNKKSAG